MSQSDLCSICYDTTIDYTTDCNHDFCNQCITNWLLSNNNCPLCRKKFYEIVEEPLRNIDNIINNIIYIYYIKWRYVLNHDFHYYSKLHKNINGKFHSKMYRFDNTNYNHNKTRY